MINSLRKHCFKLKFKMRPNAIEIAGSIRRFCTHVVPYGDVLLFVCFFVVFEPCFLDQCSSKMSVFTCQTENFLTLQTPEQ